jgi:histidine triad (HIT) family protein
MFAAAAEMAGREGVVDGGYRLTINQGDDAGQQVPHLHLHLLAGKTLGRMG